MSSNLRKRIDGQRVAELTRRLIERESENPPGNEAGVGDVIAIFCERLGLEVTRQPVAGDRFNVIARLPGRNRNHSFAYNGHLDVVPAGPAELWTTPAFTPDIRDGRLYGRGACDMKGSVAAFMHVLECLVDQDEPPAVDIVFTAVIDEEKSNKGIKALLDSGFHADWCVVGEPTGMDIAIGHRGVIAFELIMDGVACHAAQSQHGANALYHAVEAVQAIRNLDRGWQQQRSNDVLGQSRLQVTGCQSGVKVNVIPARASLQIDGRLACGETEAQVRDALEAELSRLQAAGSIGSWQLNQTTFCPSGLTPVEAGISRHCAAAVERARGMAPRLYPFEATCEAAFLMEAGIKTLIIGPGSIVQAHQADEFVELDQLEMAALGYAQIIDSLDEVIFSHA